MREVPVSSLVANTYFDRPVFLDERFVLLSPDTPVTDELIRRLRKWKYTKVHSDGQNRQVPAYLQGAGQAALAPQTIDEDISADQQRVAAQMFWTDAVTFPTTLFGRFAEDGTLNLAQVTEWTKGAIQALREQRDWVMRYAWADADQARWLELHEVRSTLLALLIGDFLKAPPHRLIELGNASLLHDIGMHKLPESLLSSREPLTPEQRRAIDAHTALGYRLLKGVSTPENVALAALEHHEHVDGSGYPRNLVGDKITEYARIITVASEYEALVSPRPFRPPVAPPYAAIRDLLQKNRARYDERVLKALVYVLSVWPLGTRVLLSNGSRGEVVGTDPGKPRCPVVRVLADPEGKRPAKSLLIQAAETGGVSVVRALTTAEANGLGQPG